MEGAIASPNIWQHPEVYEVENRAVDPDGLLAGAIGSVVDWTGRDVLDVGCGSGFHLPWFAATARSVVGVEPHPPLVGLTRRRIRRLEHVRVLNGVAQDIPLPDRSVDVAHARWAYFFGPGCEPGLAELSRVLRRGGTALVINNDYSRSTWGRWFRRGYPHLPAYDVVERFWSTQGFTRVPVLTRWAFDSRADLERVVRIELDPATADAMLAEVEGTDVDYAVNLWWRTF